MSKDKMDSGPNFNGMDMKNALIGAAIAAVIVYIGKNFRWRQFMEALQKMGFKADDIIKVITQWRR